MLEGGRIRMRWATALSILALFAGPGLSAPTIYGGTGLIEIPTAEVVPQGSISLMTSVVHKAEFESGSWEPRLDGEKTLVTYIVDVGIARGVELGVARWQVPVAPAGWQKNTVINAKVQIQPMKGILPAVAVGARDLGAKAGDSPQFYAVATAKLPLLGARAHYGIIRDAKKSTIISGADLSLTGNLKLMAEYEGRKLNLGLRLTLPLVGIYGQAAVLDVDGAKDVSLAIGWRLRY